MLRSDTIKRCQRPVQNMIGSAKYPAFFNRGQSVRLFHNANHILITGLIMTITNPIMTINASCLGSQS